MTSKAKFFAAGNQATGFIAMGNVVTGVIAIGNVARGFIAIGNVAVGVFAVGNVAFGIVFSAGASISVGLVAYAMALAVPTLHGSVLGHDISWAAAFLPPLAWAVASFIWRGERPKLVGVPALTTLSQLRSGGVPRGWVTARLQDAQAGLVVAETKEGQLAVSASSKVMAHAQQLTVEGIERVLLELSSQEQIDAEAQADYRQAPETERVLHCEAIQTMPKRPVPWASSSHLQWYLAWAWRFGAVIGLLGAIGRLMLG